MRRITCPACGGEGALLGNLGRRRWFRCIDCGIDFQHLSKRKPRERRPAWGSQEWAETRGDDLGESPDY